MTNHPNRAKAPMHCAYCGKSAQKDTHKVWNPHGHGDPERAAWDYAGNGIVIKRDYHYWPPSGSEDHGEGPPQRKWLSSVSVWDGESWHLVYDPFCTLKCAEAFARAAHKAGYRMQRRTAA